MTRNRMALLLIGLGAAAPAFSDVAGWAMSDLSGPKALTLAQSSPVQYTPNTAVEIVVVITSFDTTGLLALGLTETLPVGWAYQSMRAIMSQAPPLVVFHEDTRVLDCAWITPPALPCSFGITILPPGDSGDTVSIVGQLEYRLGGGPIHPDPASSVLYGPDSVMPVITLFGDNPVVIDQGVPYIEPGWTATGPEGENLHDLVQVAGTVDVLTPGAYTLTYSVSTDEGFPAVPVQRVVQVNEVPNKDPLCCYGTPGSSRGISPDDTIVPLTMFLVLFAWPRRRQPARPEM